MTWNSVIGDFAGLAGAVVKARSRNKLAGHVGHNKKTINDWMAGAMPSKPEDVAWVIRYALANGVDVGRFQTYAPIYDFSAMLSYEEKAAAEPPDFSWLTQSQQPPVIKTDFCGIELDCPLGIASSPLTANGPWAELMLNLGYGLSTLKTRRAKTTDSWRIPQIAFALKLPDLLNYDPASPPTTVVVFNRQKIKYSIPNIVNSIGVPSESPAEWQEIYARIQSHQRGRHVGLSVMGDGDTAREIEESFAAATEAAKDVRPPFVELNLSCPNREKGTDICDDTALAKRICKRAREILAGTGIILVVKLPHRPAPQMRSVIKVIGPLVDAVALRNTIKVRPVQEDRDGRLVPAFPGRDFGGLSGPSTFEITRAGLTDLIQIRKELGLEFKVIAVGGVSTQADVMDTMNAGADVVQACTAPMFDPLLAWKVRFHLKQIEAPSTAGKPLRFLPRDAVEMESLQNAYEAASELQRRYPDRAVPWSVFSEKWDLWMEQRPSSPVGKARRVEGARPVADWVRDFTSWKR